MKLEAQEEQSRKRCWQGRGIMNEVKFKVLVQLEAFE
jgi:hypothetical protein